MRATLRLLDTTGISAGSGLWKSGHPGTHPWRNPQAYKTYRSKYGPQYKVPFHIYGIDAKKAVYIASVAATLGTTAGVGAIFFLDGVPRVKKDILSKVPFIGKHFVNEVPPEDNPF